MSLLESVTFLSKNEADDAFIAPHIAYLTPMSPLNLNNATTPEVISQVAQANITNDNLGIFGLQVLNAGVIGANAINTGTTVRSNIVDINIIAGTGLFPPIVPLSFANTASVIPSQANIINSIIPSMNLPALNYNTVNLPQSNIVNASVPFVNLPGLVPVGQPNTAMNQNFLNSGLNNNLNTGFINAFNTGGFGGSFGGGIGVSESYAFLSIIGALTVFIIMRRKKNNFLQA